MEQEREISVHKSARFNRPGFSGDMLRLNRAMKRLGITFRKALRDALR